jgi:hypothetical protein
MHHLKETVIDGVKFVLIPEELHDVLALHIKKNRENPNGADWISNLWLQYDPEIFNAL